MIHQSNQGHITFLLPQKQLKNSALRTIRVCSLKGQAKGVKSLGHVTVVIWCPMQFESEPFYVASLSLLPIMKHQPLHKLALAVL